MPDIKETEEYLKTIFTALSLIGCQCDGKQHLDDGTVVFEFYAPKYLMEIRIKEKQD